MAMNRRKRLGSKPRRTAKPMEGKHQFEVDYVMPSQVKDLDVRANTKEQASRKARERLAPKNPIILDVTKRRSVG